MDIWEKRRRNLRALMAIKGLNATKLATSAGLSANTVSKFLRGETNAVRWDTLEMICAEVGIASPTILDSDNPFSDVKNRLYEIIDKMSEEAALKELKRLEDSAN